MDPMSRPFEPAESRLAPTTITSSGDASRCSVSASRSYTTFGSIMTPCVSFAAVQLLAEQLLADVADDDELVATQKAALVPLHSQLDVGSAPLARDQGTFFRIVLDRVVGHQLAGADRR